MSATATNPRDYNLAGPENQSAVDAGLVSADWYHSDIPRKVMKELMKRSDAPATRDTLLWVALIIISAIGAIAFWGTLQVIPFLIFYGVLYG